MWSALLSNLPVTGPGLAIVVLALTNLRPKTLAVLLCVLLAVLPRDQQSRPTVAADAGTRCAPGTGGRERPARRSEATAARPASMSAEACGEHSKWCERPDGAAPPRRGQYDLRHCYVNCHTVLPRIVMIAPSTTTAARVRISRVSSGCPPAGSWCPSI